MEESRLLKASWVLYAVFLVVAAAVTVLNIVRPFDFFVGDYYEVYVGESWSAFAAQQPRQAALYENFSRGASASMLSAIVLGLFITLRAYRRGEPWAWVALTAGLIVANGPQVVLSLATADAMGVLFWAAWLCVGLIILLLPVKDMLGQKAATTIPHPADALSHAQP